MEKLLLIISITYKSLGQFQLTLVPKLNMLPLRLAHPNHRKSDSKGFKQNPQMWMSRELYNKQNYTYKQKCMEEQF